MVSGKMVKANTTEVGGVYKTEIPILNSVGDSYTEEIVSENGEKGYITVTKIDGDDDFLIRPSFWLKWHTRPNVANGTYNVNVTWGVTNAKFNATIHNKKITRVFDPWHFHIVGSSGTLTRDSDTQATYYFQFNMSVPWINGPSWTGGIRAKIENGALVTYVQ